MNFYKITSDSDLAPGYYGIREPKPDALPVDSYKNAVCVTPGLMFLSNGHRLGYGKGYYDKFFAAHPEITKIGFVFEHFVFPKETMKTDSFDIPVDALITERRIYRVR
jgi:5-formyltetrahydrofolate cyclo-ligase